jgi:sigma-E factor negative regulatory protein RseB
LKNVAAALALVGAQLFAPGVAFAQGTAEALAWLRKIHDATEKLSYSGTFVYQQGERMEASRIARLVDAGGAVERLEVVDGLAREIIRTKDGVRCYLPGSQTIKVDRSADLRSFPAVLPDHISGLAAHYEITLGDQSRVAGFDCQTVILKPRDGLRYGYKLWADIKSGMLLKSRTLDEGGHTVEQFRFTQLTLGGVTRERIKARHASRSRDWKVDDAAVVPADLAGAGWIVNADQLPGFRKVVEVQRNLRESRPVRHVVYSDGLAAVSVFIEPMRNGKDAPRTGLASAGAINVFTREVANHLVTVVGEAPAASVQRVANTVEFRRPSR